MVLCSLPGCARGALGSQRVLLRPLSGPRGSSCAPRNSTPPFTSCAKQSTRSFTTMAATTVDQDAVRADWKERGYSFGVFVDPPGQVWPDFVHATDELVILKEGEIELSFNGKQIRPAVGEEVLIPAKTSHTVENIGRTTNRWLYGYKNR